MLSFHFHFITFEIRYQCSHRSAIHCQILPTTSTVQTTAIWRVELKCLKDGQSFRTSIAEEKFHKIVNVVFSDCNERFALVADRLLIVKV